MGRKRQPSLKRRLILQPLVLQLFTLFVAFMVLVAVLLRVDIGGHFADETVGTVAAEAIVRHSDGRLTVRMTPALAKLVKQAPNTWFVAQDDEGRTVSFGQVPPIYASLAATLRDIPYASFRDDKPPYRLAASIRRERTAAGRITILSHGKVMTMTLLVSVTSNLLMIPIFLLLAVVTIIVTPWIVGRSLAGVARIAREAERIDIDRRGIRLSEAEVPREIGPLVRAVNEALARLDQGYERQRRFIASAAHELRTPIAILRVKLEAAGDATARRLLGDVARLSTLAEQLLDLHRIENDAPAEHIDLAQLVRRVTADMAPLVIGSGAAIEALVESAAPITGNAGAIERVVTNLIQNAIEHGGQRIAVRVYDTVIEVEDDGPGIPIEERERVFEAFHRLRPRPTGTGLGLNLVRQVMERHGGRVTIHDAPSGGVIMRVEFPAA